MAQGTGTQSGASGSDGFWSVIGQGFAQGIATVGSDVLPRWVGKSVGTQMPDQLADTTYQIPGGGDSGSSSNGSTFGVSNDKLLIGAAAAVGAGLLVYVVSR